jgi:hypothetical protein
LEDTKHPWLHILFVQRVEPHMQQILALHHRHNNLFASIQRCGYQRAGIYLCLDRQIAMHTACLLVKRLVENVATDSLAAFSTIFYCATPLVK